MIDPGASSDGLLFDGRPFTSELWTTHIGPVKDLKLLRRSGAVHSPLDGVFLDRRVVETPELRASALTLVLPPGAAVARQCAAWLHGVDARTPAESHLPVPLQCVVDSARHPVHRPGVKCYSAELLDRDVCEIAGIPVTTPARTTLDVLRWYNSGAALGCADAFARRGLIVPAALAQELERWRGRYGVATARELVVAIDGRADSALESAARLRSLQAGIPRPDLQIEVRWGGQVRRIDFGWRDARVGVEAYGQEFHTGADRVASDADREAWLNARGWRLKIAWKSDIWGRNQDFEYGLAAMLGLTITIRPRTW